MKALVSPKPGGADSLQFIEMPVPSPGPGEVRVAVRACGINYPDTLIIADRYQFRPERPFAPGAEVAGLVDSIGDGVGLGVGDRVIADGLFGGLAERAVFKASRCYPMPDDMPFAIGAAFLMTYATSHHALCDRAALKAGETLLVLGAGGGVGLAAVEIGKRLGARVIGGASSAEKAAAAKAHGADAVFVYPTDLSDGLAAKAFSQQVRAIAGGDVDVVYDPVGGGYSEPALRTLGWGGRFLVVGFPAGIAKMPLNLPLLKGCSVVGVFLGGFVERYPERYRRTVEDLMVWWSQGALHPEVTERYPLARGGEAIGRLADRRAIGKVVVEVGDDDLAALHRPV